MFVRVRKKTVAILTAVMMMSAMMPQMVLAAKVTEPEAEYVFDHTQTAVSQLDDLFTTIDIMDATVSELTDEMEKGNVTSEQLVQMYIDRIKAYDSRKKINSIISINPDALEEARALDEERAAGNVRGPLHGIPVIVKDNYDMAGTATTAGSLALADFIPGGDAFVVQKLKAAGAVIFAKANMSEFASSAVNSHSLIGGYVHNPYDTTRSPAGSSGGTAAAVTSNFAALGYGTDTGGSIRNPSSWCNLYGIRPTKGLTSIDGVLPLIVSRDTTGPMARTAEDMALALETIAGTDENDDYTVEADADGMLADGYTKYLSADGLKGKRIGYLESSFSYESIADPDDGEGSADEELTGEEHTDEELTDGEAAGEGEEENTYKTYRPDEKVEQMIKRTRADLRKAGASFVDMSDVITDDFLAEVYMYYLMNDADTCEYDINRYFNDHGDKAPFRTVGELITSGKDGIDYSNLYFDPEKCAASFEETENPYTEDVNGFMRTANWAETLSFRDVIAEAMEEKNVDAIMFVSEINVPFKDSTDYDTILQNMEQTSNAIGNIYAYAISACLGFPDMMLPMGFSETDEKCPSPMPLGMHFIGRTGGEKALMQIAYAYEQQAGADIRRMPEITPALKDKNLNAYLETLMDEVYCIDYSAFGRKPEGKAKLLEKAYDRAAAADTSDPYAVYNAACDLAKAYDKTVAALKASGVNLAKAKVEFKSEKYSYTGSRLTPEPKVTIGGVTLNKDTDYKAEYSDNLNAGTASVVISPASDRFAGSKAASFRILKGKTTFKAKASKEKLKASSLKNKKKAVTVRVTGLSKGSSKPVFSVLKVTNGQRSGVSVNSRTGKVTIKKNTKKCTIYIKVASKANKNRKAETRTVKIAVR